MRDIVERNLEIAAQCCIDISHRVISLEDARKPADYYEAILLMGELGVFPQSCSYCWFQKHSSASILECGLGLCL